VFVGAGDIAFCDGNADATARLLDGIGGTVFTLGDHAYPKGAEQEFRDCYEPTWGRHKARTRPSPGNHDYESPGGSTYFAYFGASAGPPGLGYYDFQLGSWHVLSLNSNTGIPAQVTWLKNVLGRSRSRCTIAFWHHPLYSSGTSPKVAGIRDWWEVLYEFGADVVLSSHDHLYERFAPQDDRGRPDPERGIRQFIVGTGGAPQHADRSSMPNSEMLFNAFGVLKLTLLSDSYEWEFIPVSGPGDSGRGRCH
jgi:acid phosphatase type 7